MSTPLKNSDFSSLPWIRLRYSGVIVERAAKVEDLCGYNIGEVAVTISGSVFTTTFDTTYFDDVQLWKIDNPNYQTALDVYRLRQKVEKIIAFTDCEPLTFSEDEMAEFLTVDPNAVNDDVVIPWSNASISLDNTWFLQDIDCQDDVKAGISRVTGVWRKDGEWTPVRIDGSDESTTTTTTTAGGD